VDGPVTEAQRERTARALAGYRRTEDASWQTTDPLGFNPRHRDRGTRRITSRMGQKWADGQMGSDSQNAAKAFPTLWGTSWDGLS